MISVFGGTGFVGSHWVRQTAFRKEVIPRDSVLPMSSEVLYFISTTHNYWPQTDPLLDINTNLVHLMEVLRRMRPGEVFNFVSSWFVYGVAKDWEKYPAHEEDPCDPRGFYSITKRAAEQLIVSYCEMRGIRWRIFRLANVFGPGDRPSEKKNALQHFIGLIAKGESFPLYWGGACLRDYIHVRDVASAIDVCLRRADFESITNVGYGRSFLFGDLLSHARSCLGSPSQFGERTPSALHKQVQTRHFRMDTDRLRGLGFVPNVTPEKGIEELCNLLSVQQSLPSGTQADLPPASLL